MLLELYEYDEIAKNIKINMLLELYEYDEIAKNINFANISSFLNGKKAYVSETMLKNFLI